MNPSHLTRVLVPVLFLLLTFAGPAKGNDLIGIEITGERPATAPTATPTVTRGRDEILETPAPDTGAVLNTLPGVEAVRRGAAGLDPVVRGLQGDRVNVLVDGTRIYGGCPSRMDPSTMYVSPWSLEKIEVVKGPYSVTDGPGGLGGTVKLDTHTVAAGSPRELRGSISWDTVRAGSRVEASAGARGERLDVAATAGYHESNNYEAGDGTEVPAGFTAIDGAIDLGLATDLGRLDLSLASHLDRDVAYPALPMDAEKASSYRYALGLEREGVSERVTGYEGRLYLNTVDHIMNNDHKPNFAAMQAETDSDADTYGGRAQVDLKTGNGTLSLGGDGYRVARDATRDRTMTMMGMPMTTRDRLWPDTHITDLGLFAEWQRPIGDRLTLRAGGRADRVTARADATDAASSLAGATVEEAYVAFYGSDAADTDADEFNVGGNLRLGWQIDDRWQAYVGAGSAVRTADATERYAAFAPAPGGYRVGDPTLDPERSWQLDVGVEGTAGPLTLSADSFVNRVEDYILVTVIEDRLRDFNNDGVNDVVKGYHNLDRAFLWGGEAAATWAVTDAWAIAGSLTYIEGQNRDDDQPLPEIAPLSSRLQLRYDDPDGRYWGAVGSRLVARQDRADATFGEDETGGFTTFDVRGGRRFGDRWQLTVVVENLLDRTYHEHLTREAFLPVGDLATGDEVPEPGLGATVTLAASF
ncbi:MAG: TonB-dependent receptor [Nitrospirota bacterium]|jgi:iron complex outermembrane receptor protein